MVFSIFALKGFYSLLAFNKMIFLIRLGPLVACILLYEGVFFRRSAFIGSLMACILLYEGVFFRRSAFIGSCVSYKRVHSLNCDFSKTL